MTLQKLLRLVEWINFGWMGLFVLMTPVLSVFLADKGFGIRPGALGHYLKYAVIVQFAIAFVWVALSVATSRTNPQRLNEKD